MNKDAAGAIEVQQAQTIASRAATTTLTALAIALFIALMTIRTAALAAEGVVPVETLLYAPDEALREALALRGRIEQLGGGCGTPLGDAVDELFGLVELGLAGRA